MKEPISEKELNLIDAYWRAANYFSVGQIYLHDNPEETDMKVRYCDADCDL